MEGGIMTLCTYIKTGLIGGHWCNECPPLAEYFKIEAAEKKAFSLSNQKKKERK
jgi:hypothetical protein